jgi:hypothetical protein
MKLEKESSDILKLLLLLVPTSIKLRPIIFISQIPMETSLLSLTLLRSSLVPIKREPIAVSFNSKQGLQSSLTNVASCSMGKVGLNRAKYMYKQVSIKEDVIPFACISHVISIDWGSCTGH